MRGGGNQTWRVGAVRRTGEEGGACFCSQRASYVGVVTTFKQRQQHLAGTPLGSPAGGTLGRRCRSPPRGFRSGGISRCSAGSRRSQPALRSRAHPRMVPLGAPALQVQQTGSGEGRDNDPVCKKRKMLIAAVRNRDKRKERKGKGPSGRSRCAVPESSELHVPAV